VHATFPAPAGRGQAVSDAAVVAHPECPEAALAMVTVGSTSAIMKWCGVSDAGFIVMTESGVSYSLGASRPAKISLRGE
jgi:quinolinate synthase